MQNLGSSELSCLLTTKQMADSKAEQEMYKGQHVWMHLWFNKNIYLLVYTLKCLKFCNSSSFINMMVQHYWQLLHFTKHDTMNTCKILFLQVGCLHLNDIAWIHLDDTLLNIKKLHISQKARAYTPLLLRTTQYSVVINKIQISRNTQSSYKKVIIPQISQNALKEVKNFVCSYS